MMDGFDITRATLDELTRRYVDAAAAHQEASDVGNHRTANPAHDIVAAVYGELRRRGQADALAPLLTHENLGVRSWAGAHALEFAPHEGERVLEELSRDSGPVGFEARMTLRTWREGELHFP